MQVKRVYDIIPNNRGLVLDGPLARNMKVRFFISSLFIYEIFSFGNNSFYIYA